MSTGNSIEVKSPAPIIEKPRLPALDDIRGIAMVAVLIHHLFVFEPDGFGGALLARFAEFCGHGVDLFFVLSAYLLVRPLSDNNPGSGWAFAFWRRRAAKIFPLYFSLLLFVFLALPFALEATNFSTKLGLQQSVSANWPWYAVFASNWLNFADGRFTNPALDVAWSLAVELQFYFLLTILVRTRLHNSIRLWVSLIVVAILVRAVGQFQDWTWIKVLVATPARFDAFALGAILALRPRWFSFPVRLIGLAVFATPFILPWSRELPAVRLFGYTWVALGSASLIATFLRLDQRSFAQARPPYHRFLSFVGTISYAVYLTHVPVRAALRDLILPSERVLSTAHDWLVQGGFFAAAGTACLGFGWLAWILVERPAQQLILLKTR